MIINRTRMTAASPPPTSREILGVTLSYFFFYCGVGIIVPYLSPLLVTLGYSRQQIGLIQAASSAFMMVMPALVGRLSDRFWTADGVLRGCTVLGFAAALFLWWQAQAVAWIFTGALLLVALCRAPMISLQDTLAMQVAQGQANAYARLRMIGSIGFMLTATVAGIAFQGALVERYFPALVLVLAGMGVSTTFLPSHHRTTVVQHHASGFWRSLSPHWWLWLGAMVLHWMSFGPYHYGLTLFMQEIHVPEHLTGVLWSFAVLCEVLSFYAARWVFKRWAFQNVLFFALGVTFLRWLLLGLFPTQSMLWITQPLHGPGFALFYAACMQGVQHFSAGHHSASYQGLLSTGVSGFGSAAGIALAGWLHQRMPFAHVWLWMLVPQGLALVLLASVPRSQWSTRS